MPLSTGIEALRRGDPADEDNVVLSLKYQAPPQDLIPVDTGLEVVSINTEEMEVDFVEQNVDNDEEELFGIDDVDAFVKIVVKKTVDDLFEDISDKVDMDLAEKVDCKVKADMYFRLEAIMDNMDDLIQTVRDPLRLIGDTVKDSSKSFVKKLNQILVKNHNCSKII
ncbi:hypothetical protein Dimus_000778 [Dionaea muscipula]